jgi:hypothetical protein
VCICVLRCCCLSPGLILHDRVGPGRARRGHFLGFVGRLGMYAIIIEIYEPLVVIITPVPLLKTKDYLSKALECSDFL